MGCVSKEIGRETSPSRDLSSSPDPKKITVEEPIHQDPATKYPIYVCIERSGEEYEKKTGPNLLGSIYISKFCAIVLSF